MDDYYLKKGTEYVAYENLRKAREAIEESGNAIQETAPEVDRLRNELEDAQYNFDLATNEAQYDERKAIRDRVKAELEAVEDRNTKATQVNEEMNNNLQDLEQELADARTARENEAQRILDRANIQVEEYDPERDGPPALPEEDSSTGDDQANDQGNDQGNNPNNTE